MPKAVKRTLGREVKKYVDENGVEVKIVTDRKGRVKKIKTKKDGEKTVIKNTRRGQKTKQKNKSEDGVRSRFKEVYRGDGGRMVTKRKQTTNRKGKKAGMLSMKDKVVDRKNFSVRRKTKGVDPKGGA